MKEIKVTDTNLSKYSKETGKAGVYIWGYYKSKNFIPLYVGKSRNLFERLIQHYCRFKSGEYRMFDINDIENNNSNPKPIYEPTNFNEVVNNFDKKFISYENALKNFAFRYLEMPASTEETRANAERQLAKLVEKHTLITKVGKSDFLEIEVKLKELIMDIT